MLLTRHSVNRLFIAVFAIGLLVMAAVAIARGHYGDAFFAGLGGLWLGTLALMGFGGHRHHSAGCAARSTPGDAPAA